jgi:hypothetical protein
MTAYSKLFSRTAGVITSATVGIVMQTGVAVAEPISDNTLSYEGMSICLKYYDRGLKTTDRTLVLGDVECWRGTVNTPEKVDGETSARLASHPYCGFSHVNHLLSRRGVAPLAIYVEDSMHWPEVSGPSDKELAGSINLPHIMEDGQEISRQLRLNQNGQIVQTLEWTFGKDHSFGSNPDASFHRSPLVKEWIQAAQDIRRDCFNNPARQKVSVYISSTPSQVAL